jgi:glutamine synthetase
MGLSELAYQFVGGLKAHAKAYIAVTAPTVTSYKRLVTSTTLSGSTWAPVYISYGYNNRTQMLRIPAGGRIEDRTVDGSCNPYLAATVILAAGLDGIEKGLEAGDPTTELNLHELSQKELDDLGVETLPSTLLDAARELERDDVMRAALGTTATEDYVDYFARIKKNEFKLAHEQITQWELNRYLQLF